MDDLEHSIVLFDGVCNLCNGSVNFLLDRDGADRFRFAALQSEAGESLLNEHDIDRKETDSIVLIENGAAFTRSTAALRIARGLGGFWALAYGFIVVPEFLRDAVYRLVARYRYTVFGKSDTCRIPTPDEAAKFI